MNQTIRKLLDGNAENHMLPFFWQHGEDEATLREYMAAMDAANCHAVCVESRPHPDYCGDKWWQDMDVILDEARKRKMKVWILDDSHFPTGFANGALKNYPDALCKQNIFMTAQVVEGETGRLELNLREAGLLVQPKTPPTGFAAFMPPIPPARVYDDDSILGVSAQNEEGLWVDLTDHLEGETLHWEQPGGKWTIHVCVRSRNTGCHRDYINVTEEDSCRVLIDAVYEKHWEHYAADFGKTIAGFFSDEPELGNGDLYVKYNHLGTQQDLPWGAKLESMVAEALGENWRCKLPLLWQDGEGMEAVRVTYMDCLTKRIREAFSNQIAGWCHDHGVQYIGHIIEDDGQHCRTGSSMGHYFRSLQGQDMSGIDDIGGQVYPQGEEEPKVNFMHMPRNGEFYHYGLAKLAQSAAAIEPNKKGNAMCEIFGNYGWQEGVRLEKYLADHFLVRGVNYYVPHAFTPKAFPDPDCPPHFYAHGHNPQYRHFGQLCGYMNRVATLISSGRHVMQAAVLYHAEAEWADKNAMPFEKPLRALYDAQIDCHVVPADVLTEVDRYGTKFGNPLQINKQKYHAFIVPAAKFLPDEVIEKIHTLMELGLPVYFVEECPAGVRNGNVVSLQQLPDVVRSLGLKLPKVEPASDRIRILHIDGQTDVFFVVNEAAQDWEGTLTLPAEGDCLLYDAWENVCHRANAVQAENGVQITMKVEPLKSIAVVFGKCDAEFADSPKCGGECVELLHWNRSVCPGIAYPKFTGEQLITLPDKLAQEQPEFSGFVRYETALVYEPGLTCTLEITDAKEGVEVFVNGMSLGIQIAPPFRYDLTGHLQKGENQISIEVATTLERQCYPMLDGYRKMMARVPCEESGINGTVKLYIPNSQ